VPLDYGDTVQLTRFPPGVTGTVVRRCGMDNRYIWVDEPIRGRIRVKEKDTRKVKDVKKTKA